MNQTARIVLLVVLVLVVVPLLWGTMMKARAVTTLLSEGVVEVGTRLSFTTSPVRVRLRAAVQAWIAEDPSRGQATWRNDSRAPLVWALDGSTWSPTGLAREIVAQATGERLHVFPGPRCWVGEDGHTLAELAGFEGGTSRDWSDLHAALELVGPGEWTTYGDLAEVVGSASRAVGQHITTCDECPNAYRVLTADGAVADQFRWSDADDERQPRDVLEAEGVRFNGDRADGACRVTAQLLRARMRA